MESIPGVRMECSSCGTENRADARFCGECGGPLARACETCGNQLRPTSKFCDACGAPAEIATPNDPAGRPAVATDGAVRKTVTVLFCDLEGSTAFGESVDAEAAREAMGRYHAMAAEVVEMHGGTIAKFIGDGVMAVFGVPEVGEDDAHRAVEAGLDLQRRFEPIAGHVLDRYGAEIGLRVGVNSGELVIADADADLVGDVINTAARIEAGCRTGCVHVGEETWRLTRSTIKYDSLGEVAVRGKSVPVRTFEVVETGSPDEQAATPFVGRTDELARLRGSFDAAVAARHARMVAIIGSPGVGKTRLAAELARVLGDDVAALDVRVERSGTAALSPVADLIRKVAKIDGDATADEVLERIGEALGPHVEDRDRVTPLLAGLVGATPTRSTEESFFAVRRLLEVLASDRPLLLVVDDVQWAEPLFLDLLDHLAEWVSDAPILVVALARPEIREVRPSLAVPERWVTAIITIEGLDADSVEQLAAELLGTDRLPPELAARLPESTEGNPLFVRELVRMLVDDGVISRTEDGWRMAIDVEAVEVPPTIQSLLAARVERMPDDERRVVELASVLGSEFPRGAVSALGDRNIRATIDGAFERLRRKQVFDATGSYWGDEPLFRFHHVLIRDAAYRRLLKEARADLHLRAGDWIETTADGLVGEYEESIGHHFELAHAYRRELGLPDDSAGERAAALLAVAARRALVRDDLLSAGTLATRALACLAPGASSRAELLVVACEALLGSGDVAAGREVLAELDAVATDPRLRAWSACFGAQLSNLTEPGTLTAAATALADAAEELAALGDEAGVAKARQVRAGTLARLGRVGDAEAELDLALNAARSVNDSRRITAVLGSAPAAALWGPSPVPRAGGRCLDVIRLLRITTGSPAVEATSVRCQAVLEALRGRFDTARSMIDTARIKAQELGLRQSLMETELYAGLVELFADAPEAAETYLRIAYAGLGERGIAADAGQAAAHLARAVLLQGRLDEAEELAASADALAGQNTRTLIAARGVEAEILAARGDLDRAVGCAEEAVALAEGRDLVVDHAQAFLTLARVHEIAGSQAEASAARAAARRLFQAKGATIGPQASSAQAGATSDTTVVAAPARSPVAAGSGEERSVNGRDRSDLRRGDDGEAPGATMPRRLHNAATRLGDLRAEQLIAGDERGVRELMSPDYVFDDRRSGVGGARYGVEAFEETARMIGTRSSRLRANTLATRGDRLALVRARFDLDGFESDGLHIESLDEQGRHDRTVMFDVDDLLAAFDELNRLYLEGEAAAHRRVVEPWIAAGAALNHHDADAFAAAVSPNASIIDHRPMGWPDMNREEFIRLASAPEAMGRGMTGITEVVRVGAAAAVATCFTFVEQADDFDAPMWQFIAVTADPEDGRIEFFPLDELDAAIARFDEHEHAGAGLGNRASRVLAKQVDGASVIATRADSLCLAEIGSDSRLVLASLGSDGELEQAEYEPDHLRAALRELDRRYLETEVGRAAVMYTYLLDAEELTRAGDVERLMKMFDPECMLVDHRPLAFGNMTVAERMRSLAEVGADVFIFTRAVHELEPTRYVTSRQWRISIPDTSVTVVDTVQLSEVDPNSGLLVGSDMFDIDQLGEATELSAQRADSIEARLSPANWATATGALLWRRAVEGDLHGFTAAISRDCLRVRPSGREGRFEPDDVVLAGYAQRERRIVAVRSDHLALVAWEGTDEPTTFAIEEIDDRGRLCRLTEYPGSRLIQAANDLNDRWLETPGDHGAEVEMVRRLARDWDRANREYDMAARAELLAIDYRFIDRRQLGYGTMDRDATLETTRVRDARGVNISSVVHEITVHGMVGNLAVYELIDGSGWTESMPCVTFVHVAAGQVVHTELFPEEELDMALARLHALSSPQSPRATDLQNAATRTVDRFAAAVSGGTPDLIADRIADDVRRIDLRSGVAAPELVGREAYLDSLRAYAEIGFREARSEPIAVFGERLALVEGSWVTNDGAEITFLMLCELDARGHTSALVSFDFDALATAYKDFSRRVVASGEASDAYETMIGVGAAMNASDWDTLTRLVSPDLVFVDRRPAAWGRLDRQGWIERIAANSELASDLIGYSPVVHVATDSGILSRTVLLGTVDGAKVEWATLTILMIREGQLVRAEYFADDELDAALARFAELTEPS